MEVTFSTEKGKATDVTGLVENVVKESRVDGGIVNVFAPHATGVLILGENEPNIVRDYFRLMEKLAPEGGGWDHDRIDNNAHAHLRSAIFGTSICIPVREGRLALGTWQRVLFLETDGDRDRRLIVTVLPAR